MQSLIVALQQRKKEKTRAQTTWHCTRLCTRRPMHQPHEKRTSTLSVDGSIPFLFEHLARQTSHWSTVCGKTGFKSLLGQKQNSFHPLDVLAHSLHFIPQAQRGESWRVSLVCISNKKSQQINKHWLVNSIHSKIWKKGLFFFFYLHIPVHSKIHTKSCFEQICPLRKFIDEFCVEQIWSWAMVEHMK